MGSGLYPTPRSSTGMAAVYEPDARLPHWRTRFYGEPDCRRRAGPVSSAPDPGATRGHPGLGAVAAPWLRDRAAVGAPRQVGDRQRALLGVLVAIITSTEPGSSGSKPVITARGSCSSRVIVNAARRRRRSTRRRSSISSRPRPAPSARPRWPGCASSATPAPSPRSRRRVPHARRRARRRRLDTNQCLKADAEAAIAALSAKHARQRATRRTGGRRLPAARLCRPGPRRTVPHGSLGAETSTSTWRRSTDQAGLVRPRSDGVAARAGRDPSAPAQHPHPDVDAARGRPARRRRARRPRRARGPVRATPSSRRSTRSTPAAWSTTATPRMFLYVPSARTAPRSTSCPPSPARRPRATRRSGRWSTIPAGITTSASWRPTPTPTRPSGTAACSRSSPTRATSLTAAREVDHLAFFRTQSQAEGPPPRCARSASPPRLGRRAPKDETRLVDGPAVPPRRLPRRRPPRRLRRRDLRACSRRSTATTTAGARPTSRRASEPKASVQR